MSSRSPSSAKLFLMGQRDEALVEYDSPRKLDESLAKRLKEFMDKK